MRLVATSMAHGPKHTTPLKFTVNRIVGFLAKKVTLWGSSVLLRGNRIISLKLCKHLTLVYT